MPMIQIIIKRLKFAEYLGLFARTKPIIFRFNEPVDFEIAWVLYLQYKDKNFRLNVIDSENKMKKKEFVM